MKQKIYIENVIDILRKLSDKDYQIAIWLNRHNPDNRIGSFDETVNMLFDDSIIGDLLEDSEVIISKGVTKNLQSLSDEIDKIDESLLEEEIVNHPSMDVIRKIATKTLAHIQASDGSESTVRFVKVGTPDTPISIQEALG